MTSTTYQQFDTDVDRFWNRFGLILGYSICWICDKYQLIQLQADVYSISHVPFKMLFTDGLLVMLVAIFVSFLATLYPSKKASRLDPVDALRYE